jgi:transcriptional regulator with PAS, ATPase and Fis domain
MGPWFDNSSHPEKLLGKSRAIRKIKKQIDIAASYDYPILISGETGVGKTLIARIIHSASKRKGKPFLHQSCSNISSELLESELFGHEKGAFTGATERKKGKIEIADGGTLFLDEIADLSLQNQAKLLLFLERGKFFRVGGTKELRADVKLISASNRDLAEEINKKRFREDLYHRINTLEIYVPPLRERREDIPILIEEILKHENKRNRTAKSISHEAMTKLLNYDYVGNVRELENIIKRAFMNSKGSEIKPDDVIFSKCRFVDKKEQKVASEQIKSTLKKYRGNKSRAAKELGISRQWLHRIIKKKKL